MTTTAAYTSAGLDSTTDEARHLPTNPRDTESGGSPDREKQESDPDTAISNHEEFPDGGLKAWSVVFGSACCMFCSLGWINCIGMMQTQYQRQQLSTYSPSTIAWIISVETFVMFGGAPFFGKIFDSYGPTWMLIGGSLFHVFGLMMTSLGSEYYQFFLAEAICSGIGASAIFYAANNSVATWFLKKRATALGVISGGSAAGGVIGPILFTHVVNLAGFPWAMRAIAFMYLGLLAIGIFFVRSRLPHSPKPWSVIEYIEPLAESRFLLLVISNFIFFVAVFLPLNYVTLEAIGVVENSLLDYLIPILNGTSAFGRVLAGLLADKIGNVNTVSITVILCVVFTLGLWIPTAHESGGLIAFTVIFGFLNGAYVSLVPTCVAKISPIKKIGVRIGTNFFICSFATLIGNPIAGALISRDSGEYLYLQIFCGVVMFVAFCFYMAAKTAQGGTNFLARV